jgi:glycosyltransferase involved in cell wall biosynthesis
MPFAMAPAKNGGAEKAVATYANLNSVADVIVLWPERNVGYGLAELPGGCYQFSVGLEAEVMSAIEADRSVWGVKGWSAALAKHISKSEAFCSSVKLLSQNADAIILSHPWLIDVVPKEFEGKLIFDSFGSEVELLASQLKSEDKRLQDLNIIVANELINLTNLFEKKAIESASIVLAMTEEEANQIASKYPKKRIEINPTGTDVVVNSLPTLKRRDSNFLFFGSAHPPNIQAALHLKKIAIANSNLNFTLAGHICNYVGRVPPNVRMYSEISDRGLNKLINTSFAFLNPITSGSGVSLKSLRVLGNGLPMISTSLGVRGISIVDGREFILTDLQGFEKEMTKLMDDEELWHALSTNSINFAKRELGWNSLSEKFASIVLEKSNGIENFEYIPVSQFSEYESLKWKRLDEFESDQFSFGEEFSGFSIWIRFIKPLLRKRLPFFVIKFIKKFM